MQWIRDYSLSIAGGCVLIAIGSMLVIRRLDGRRITWGGNNMATQKINLSSLEFGQLSDKSWNGVPIKTYGAKLPRRLEGIGIDPGRNFGIAALLGREVWVLVGELPKEDEQWLYGVAAYDMMSATTSVLEVDKVVVEGGFDGVPGAVNLTYVRMGFLLGAYYMGKEVSIVAPTKIRKTVLGDGKKRGAELITGLPDHGSDALIAALYAAGVTYSDIQNGPAGPKSTVVLKSKGGK